MRRTPHNTLESHSNRFKRLRAQVNALVAAAGGPKIRHAVKHAVYETLGVPSRRYSITVKNEDGTETVHKNMATQVRMQAGSPRKIYQDAKHHVSDNR
jgi:hypothetical protein